MNVAPQSSGTRSVALHHQPHRVDHLLLGRRRRHVGAHGQAHTFSVPEVFG